jgi:hypothetical protein
MMLESSSKWSAVCSSAGRKRLDTLKPFMLPLAGASDVFAPTTAASTTSEHVVGAVNSGDAASQSGSTAYSATGDSAIATQVPTRDEANAMFASFLATAPVGVTVVIPGLLAADDRQALHHRAQVVGVESKRVGKQQRGRYQVQLRKPIGWLTTGPRQPAPQWTLADRSAFRAAMGLRTHASTVAPSSSIASNQPSSSIASNQPTIATFTATVFEHNQLKTVALLRGGMRLDELRRKYKLILKEHPLQPLVQLSYTQTESNMSSAIVQECRGLILEKETYAVVSFPFCKFFNHAETLGAAGKFDWTSATVYEKLDGSLMTMYWYAGVWNVATNKLPAADGKFPNSSTKSFAAMFWDTWAMCEYALPPVSAQNTCFMFELTSPDHTIIVRHTAPQLVCLGGRNLTTLHEISVEEIASTTGWATPRTFPALNSLASAVNAARILNPVVQEGFVAKDGASRRLKIKNPGYVALHHLGGNFDRSGGDGIDAKFRRRRLLQIARENEGSEFLAYYPALAVEYGCVHGELSRLVMYLTSEGGVLTSTQHNQHGSHLKRLVQKYRTSAQQPLHTIRDAAIRDLENALDEIPSSFMPSALQLEQQQSAATAARDQDAEHAASNTIDPSEDKCKLQIDLDDAGEEDAVCAGGFVHANINRFAALFGGNSSSDDEEGAN